MTRDPAIDLDDLLRILDKPEADWGVQEWQALATYLWSELQVVRSQRDELLTEFQTANNLLAEQVSILKMIQALKKAHSVLWASGSLVVKPPRKTPGRKKSEPDDKMASALVVLAGRHGTMKAAAMLAAVEMKSEGRDPKRWRTDFGQRTKTWANRLPELRRRIAAEILREHGPGPETEEQLKQIGASPNPRPRKTKPAPDSRK